MIRTYKLKFDNEAQAITSVSAAVTGIPSYNYSIKVIGIHKEYEYEYDETDPEAEPTVIEYDGWHVDIVSRVELEFSEQFLVEPKNPIHSFAGGSMMNIHDELAIPAEFVKQPKPEDQIHAFFN